MMSLSLLCLDSHGLSITFVPRSITSLVLTRKPISGNCIPIGANPPLVWAIVTCLGCLASAAAEELTYRAFLIPRLRRILSSRFAAIGISAMLFAMAHLYQGHTAVAQHFVASLVIGGLYLWYPRVIPFVLGHAICNLIIDYRWLESPG